MSAHPRHGAVPGPVPLVTSPAAKLEADAISAAQDAFIGAALVGPTVSVALTLAALAAATAYGAPVTLALTAIPVLVIVNAYRRLNLWNARCLVRVGRPRHQPVPGVRDRLADGGRDPDRD